MNHRFSGITAALALAVLAGMMTACGSAGVTSSNAPDVQPDQTSAPETTAEEMSTQTEEGSDTPVQGISIPDGKIPDVTVPEIHIDMPDLSVPDINEYMSGTTDTATKDTATKDTAAKETAAQSSTSASDEIQTITDASGKYSYTGTLFQGGDDKNGYIKVPTGFYDFVDVDVNGLTQYSDATRMNIFTLAHHTGIDYKTAADNLRSHKEKQTDIKKFECTTVTIADYRAVQLYELDADGGYVVDWFIEDPADPTNSSYFLAIEFDSEHDYLLACSSTFQTVEDHNRS